MSWASRRRGIYLAGVVAFFMIVIGGPLAYWYFSIPATCFDGIQNQGETAIDKGGPCLVLDERALAPHAVLWARSFRVRDGSYNAAVYVENPNKDAGVALARYHFGLYDAQNVLVAERTGTTFVMPGGITPIFEGSIDTGSRSVTHTYFEFTDPLTWERMKNSAIAVSIANAAVSDVNTTPRVTADAHNTSVVDISSVSFVATVFDPGGNAFAASETALNRLGAGATAHIVFTWPDPFPLSVGRVDIIPLVAPSLVQVVP